MIFGYLSFTTVRGQEKVWTVVNL